MQFSMMYMSLGVRESVINGAYKSSFNMEYMIVLDGLVKQIASCVFCNSLDGSPCVCRQEEWAGLYSISVYREYVRESTAGPSPRPIQTPVYHASDQFVLVVGPLVVGFSQGLRRRRAWAG
jgi:hypothetical protein